MSKPTKEQVLAEASEKQINEWVATICHGWEKESISHFGVDIYVWQNDSYIEMDIDDFNPCLDKAQAIELAEKYELDIDFAAKSIDYYAPEYRLIWWHTLFKESPDFWKGESFTETWMQAVCKAAIISELSK